MGFASFSGRSRLSCLSKRPQWLMRQILSLEVVSALPVKSLFPIRVLVPDRELNQRQMRLPERGSGTGLDSLQKSILFTAREMPHQLLHHDRQAEGSPVLSFNLCPTFAREFISAVFKLLKRPRVHIRISMQLQHIFAVFIYVFICSRHHRWG